VRRSHALLFSGIFFVFALLINWGYTTYAIHTAKANFNQAQQTTIAKFNEAEKAGQARAAHEEQLLCLSLDSLARLKPPPGSPADNPSRAYLQEEHRVLAGLAPDIGCPH
jgi:hypothetical protein